MKTNTKTQLVAHGDYSSIANCLDISRDIWSISLYVNFLFLYSMIYRDTPYHVLRNTDLENRSDAW